MLFAGLKTVLSFSTDGRMIVKLKIIIITIAKPCIELKITSVCHSPLAEFLFLRLGSWSLPPKLKMDFHFLPLRDPFLLK
jgi:hypothetical protein